MKGSVDFRAAHIPMEPGLPVKEALWRERISRQRYDNYLEMYTELKEKRDIKRSEE